MQLHLLKTLHVVVSYEFASLDESAQWEIVALCLSVMESLSGGNALYVIF